MRTACPDCGGELGKGAVKCRCGWKERSDEAHSSGPRHTPCAGDVACRFPGRLWVRTLPHNERLCVIHYYQAIERDYSLAHDETAPPRDEKPRPMRAA